LFNLKFNSNSKVLIIAKDAGSANIISSFVKKKKIKALYHLKKPALEIFKQKKILIKKNTLKILSKNFDLLITGTSLRNRFELNAIKKAKKNNIYSVSFLDHWVNYKERFLLKNQFIFPNEIIVGDIDAYSLAKKNFSNKKVLVSLIPNYYFKEKNKFKNKRKNKETLVLLSSNYNLRNEDLTDKEIFRLILNKMKKFIIKKNIKKIIIKRHPSEDNDKFKNFKDDYQSFDFIKIEITNKTLEEVLKKNQYIAGYDTMGLVVAKLFNCNTFNLKITGVKSTIPKKYIDKVL
jgi:hypothetical protein